MSVKSQATNPNAALAVNTQQLLFVLRAADMTLTTDQPFTKVGAFTNYAVTSIYAVRKTGAGGTACLGGIYTAAAKAGDALVAATQSWLTLAASKIVAATLAALTGTNIETATPILSLSTGNTGALTADLFIYGVPLD